MAAENERVMMTRVMVKIDKPMSEKLCENHEGYSDFSWFLQVRSHKNL